MYDDQMKSEVYAVEPCEETTCIYYQKWAYYRSGNNRQVVVGTKAHASSNTYAIWCMGCTHFKRQDHYRISPDAKRRIMEEEAKLEAQTAPPPSKAASRAKERND